MDSVRCYTYTRFVRASERGMQTEYDMRIMCLNGWGGTLHQELVEYVSAEQPDVLCLQEVVHTPTAEKDWMTYRDGDHILPQRTRFFADVASVLPDHIGVFCPAAQGVLWDEDVSVPSQWGLATFVRSSIPIIGQIQGFVHKGFSPNGFGDHPRSRSAHAVRLFDFERGWPITIAHMHGLRDLEGKHDTPERRDQAIRLRGLVRQVAEPEDRIVICGDFNVEPDSETFDIFAEDGLTDLIQARGVTSTRTSHYKKPLRFADYMLTNRTLEILDFTVVTDPEVSDHCPLLLEV